MWKQLRESLWRVPVLDVARPDGPVPGPSAGAPPARPHRESSLLIEKLARALHRYGFSAQQVEDALSLVAGRLGVRGEFFATPTAIFAALETADHDETMLIRVDPGTVNLDKLSRLDRLTRQIASGEVDPRTASHTIDAVCNQPPRFKGKTRVLATALASAAAARFFGGGWREIVVCGAIGFITGLLALLAIRDARFRLFEPVAAFVAGVLASLAASVMPPTSVYVAMAGGLIVLFPGLTLTIAISELATQHLASGTARLMAAATLFMSIGFGVAVGLKAGAAVFGATALAAPIALPAWTTALAVVMASLSFVVLFQAAPRDTGWILGVCTLSFVGARVGAQVLGIETGAFIGALLVGIASGLHSRNLDRPSVVTSTPGIMMLVPGSVGFQSITDMLARDAVSGLQTAFTMIMTGVALVTGLFMARLLIPRRRWVTWWPRKER
ncbi:MAG TPA: threonine/serine exporter family protein [Candidatus Krumholzibacteria bacterium]|nr:threonine/serine exporter family protein [Candidatus Krumholzibacteria bacterium]